MIELLRQRRSVRKYEDRPIEPEQVAILEEAVLRSPSSRGFNPWEFVFVDDRALLQALAGSKPHGASFVKGAALAIVVCADESRCDVWVEDSSIATIFAQLAAQSLGLASCWVQIRKRMHDDQVSAEEHIRTLLGIPDTLRVESIVAIGYPAEEKAPHSRESLQDRKIHRNRFGA